MQKHTDNCLRHQSLVHNSYIPTFLYYYYFHLYIFVTLGKKLGQQNSNKKLFSTIDTCQEQQQKKPVAFSDITILRRGCENIFSVKIIKSTLWQGLKLTFQQCCLLQDIPNVSFEEDHSLAVLVAPPDHNWVLTPSYHRQCLVQFPPLKLVMNFITIQCTLNGPFSSSNS